MTVKENNNKKTVTEKNIKTENRNKKIQSLDTISIQSMVIK
jgi:hypothetical protein